jgi:hypothetical protein
MPFGGGRVAATGVVLARRSVLRVRGGEARSRVAVLQCGGFAVQSEEWFRYERHLDVAESAVTPDSCAEGQRLRDWSFECLGAFETGSG